MGILTRTKHVLNAFRADSLPVVKEFPTPSLSSFALNDGARGIEEVNLDIFNQRNATYVIRNLNKWRNTSRSLYYTSPIMQACVHSLRTNLLQPDTSSGVIFSGNVSGAQGLSERVGDYLNSWASGDVTIDDRNLGEALEVILWHYFIDGEAYIRRYPASGGWRIEVVDPVRVPIGEDYSDGANANSSGHLINRETGLIESYRVIQVSDASAHSITQSAVMAAETVPASDIYHVYPQQFAGQTRGIPALLQSFQTIRDYDEYQRFELNAAKRAAEISGFLKRSAATEADDSNIQTDDPLGDTVDKAPRIVARIKQSMDEMLVLNDGMDHVAIPPNHPTSNYTPYTKSLLASIAMNAALPPSDLSGDFTSTFASNYATAHNFKDRFLRRQAVIKNTFLIKLAESVLLHSGIRLPAGTDIKRIIKINFKKFAFLDPRKQAQNDIARVQMGLASPSKICEENGVNYADNVAEIAANFKLAEESDPNFAIIQKTALGFNIYTNSGGGDGQKGGAQGT